MIKMVSIGVAGALPGVAIGVAIAHASGPELARPPPRPAFFRDHIAPRDQRPENARTRQSQI